MDFIADAHASASTWLRRFGHKKAKGLEEPYLNLLYLQQFIPLPAPRRVEESREARRQLRHLTAEERRGYEQLKAEAAAGDRLTPRLTTRILNHWNSDLQSDWGLMHFHLGSTLKNNGFIERTDHLAFVWVTDERFLIVALMPHGAGADPWTDEQLLLIIQRTWPDVLRPFRMPFVELETQIVGQDREQLRTAGISLMTEIDGRVFAAPGGGSTTARTPTNAVLRYNSHRRELREIQWRWMLQFPEKEATLHLLPYSGCVITDGEQLFVAHGRGASFEPLTPLRADVYRYLLSERDPFRAPRILPA